MGDTVALLLRRLSAYTLDVALLAVVLVPLALVAGRIAAYSPSTGVEIWLASLLLISVPSWLYFFLRDRSQSGATVGKRLLRLRTQGLDGHRPSVGQALARTAVKLAPWELVHAAFFALAERPGALGAVQLLLLWVAYALLALYLGVAARFGGQRSVHDLVAGTLVGSSAA